MSSSTTVVDPQQPVLLAQHKDHGTSYVQGCDWHEVGGIVTAPYDVSSPTDGVCIRDHEGNPKRKLGNLALGGWVQPAAWSSDGLYVASGAKREDNDVTIIETLTWTKAFKFSRSPHSTLR